MTPMNSQSGDRTSRGFFIGFGIGLAGTVVLLVLCAVGGYGYVLRKQSSVRKGWNLVPAIVAAKDLQPGTMVTVDMISQRSIPEQVVTASVVTPDSVKYILSQKILVPVLAGDPMLWNDFETRMEAPVKWLFAAKDIQAGRPLEDGDFAEQPVAPKLTSDSWVPTRDRPQVFGRVVLAPFRKGDPILWTHLKSQGGK